MTRTPSMAVVLETAGVESILVQDWPAQLPLPHIVVVDYDIEGSEYRDSGITQFTIGGEPAQAICTSDEPVVYESFPFQTTLSPRTVLRALGDPLDDDGTESPLSVARRVRQSILELGARLNDREQAPKRDRYNQLYVLANTGLIDVLKAMGDRTDFGK